MAVSKKVELFLPDGDPTGCLICNVANWDGKIFRIPKTLLHKYADRPELQYTGLYFLIGGDEEIKVYIGEAEKLYRRLMQHMDEDFWSECLIIIKKEDAINKAHAKYLENFFHKLAKEVGRCKVVNGCVPTKSSISEADEAVIDDFGWTIRDVISAIGYRFLVPLIDSSAQTAIQFEITPTKSRPNVSAKGMLTNEGFVIMKGSRSAEQFSTASSKSLKVNWEELRNQGVVKNSVFVKNYLASSPSTAAAMVLGRNANGLTEWKTQDHKCLKEYLEDRQ